AAGMIHPFRENVTNSASQCQPLVDGSLPDAKTKPLLTSSGGRLRKISRKCARIASLGTFSLLPASARSRSIQALSCNAPARRCCLSFRSVQRDCFCFILPLQDQRNL